eukprot:1672602-Pyramimonas_sp.AAC.1
MFNALGKVACVARVTPQRIAVAGFPARRVPNRQRSERQLELLLRRGHRLIIRIVRLVTVGGCRCPRRLAIRVGARAVVLDELTLRAQVAP